MVSQRTSHCPSAYFLDLDPSLATLRKRGIVHISSGYALRSAQKGWKLRTTSNRIHCTDDLELFVRARTWGSGGKPAAEVFRGDAEATCSGAPYLGRRRRSLRSTTVCATSIGASSQNAGLVRSSDSQVRSGWISGIERSLSLQGDRDASLEYADSQTLSLQRVYNLQ